MHAIEKNTRLMSIFVHQDPDTVANIIVEEMNRIVNEIAPAKIIQTRKDHLSYHTAETKELKEETDKALEKAINDNENEDWRLFRSTRNRYRKLLDKCYNIYMKGKLIDPRNLWNIVESRVKPDKKGSPTTINFEGKQIRSPQKLAEVFNEYFIDKIETIRSEFKKTDDDPIEILELLIKRPNSTMKLKEITLEETYKIINDMKSSNSTGFDDVSSKILKKIPQISAILMTHSINTIIRASKFPEVYKITKIVPICKPKKSKFELPSYRPIANLTVFEKIVEQHVKEQLVNYLTENNIILDDHHGGLKGKDTLTAKATIDLLIDQAVDENKISIVLSTDLSSAFDVCDHSILVNKLEFYGIKGKEKQLFQSYLTNRTQFTQIQTKRSKLINSMNCSVIQGSRLSGLLYIIYTNEIPLLYKLMQEKEWYQKNMKENPTKYDNVEHATINFVDDSNSIITFNDSDEINYYLDRYFKILKKYYNVMKLKLNPDKTNILTVSRKARRTETTDVKIVDEKDTILPKDQIKILGWLLNFRRSVDETANKAIRETNLMIHQLQELKKHMPEKTRKMVANSHLISKMQYGMPMYISAKEITKRNIQTSIMKIVKFTKTNPETRISNTKLCKSVGWDMPQQMIVKKSLTFIHKILTEHKTQRIIQMLKMPKSLRNPKTLLKYKPSTEKYKRNMIYASLQVYNSLPMEMRTLQMKEFKKKLKTSHILTK